MSGARLLLASMVSVAICTLSCTAGPASTAEPSWSPAPIQTSASAEASAKPSATESSTAVTVPMEPLPGEVARFWFVRPGNNAVAVGPYAVERKTLVVRGACRSESGTMTWKIFDNSGEADSKDDVEFVDQGRMPCDGDVHSAEANVGKHRDLGVLAVTGTKPGKDAGESVWVIVANE